ncbi:MAG: FecR domain-containing protein [Fibrobacteres bacterium]|nr:FecR domain-containing protein [Fibrobacterota bacterium]
MKAFLLLSLAFLFVSANAQTAVGRISYFEGSVEIQRAGTTEWIPAKIKLPVNENDGVRTGKESRCEITLIEDRVLRFAENSNATLAAPEGGKTQLKTNKGSVWVNVKKLANRQNSFEVTTSVATAAIRGTVFGVDCDTGKANVLVLRGSVAMASEIKKAGVKPVSTVVNAGEECTLVSDFNKYMKDQEEAFKNFMKADEEAFDKFQKEQEDGLDQMEKEQEKGLKAMLDAEKKAFKQLGSGAAVAQRKINQDKLSKSDWANWNKKLDAKLGW